MRLPRLQPKRLLLCGLSAVGMVRATWGLNLVGQLVRFIYKRCDLILAQSKGFFPAIERWSQAPEKTRYFPQWGEATFDAGLDAVAEAPELAAHQGAFKLMFAGNFFTVAGGAGIAWMGHGLTAQAEFTVLQLTRVWGESVEKDDSRTNFTLGAHVGYQVIPWLTVSAEMHYQHWLSTPANVSANSLFRDQLTLGGGVRGNIPVGTALLRPGVAFFTPVGGPMGAMEYNILQFDLAVPL